MIVFDVLIDVADSLWYALPLSLFFVSWPVGAAFFIAMRSRRNDQNSCWLASLLHLRSPAWVAFWDALDVSVVTYLGLNMTIPDFVPEHRWRWILHRFVGILAVAYVIAVFVLALN